MIHHHIAAATRTDEDWQRFQAVDAMINHWQRPGWAPGRQAYFWYLALDSPQLRELAGHCQKRLNLPYLDPVPLNALHLTLPKIGWADEVPEHQTHRIADHASRRLTGHRPFDLTIGPLAGSSGAIRFSVAAWEPILAARHEVQEAIRTIRGQTCPEPEFRPHVGIAYCNQPVPAPPLAERARHLRDLPTVTITIRRLDLVLLRRQDRAYRWTVIRTARLNCQTPR